jgi:hypothetical protein
MDDAIDEMLAAARSIDLYELRELRPEMKDIITLISEAAAVTAEAVPLLRNVSANGNKLHDLTARLVSLEGQADEVHALGLRRAFQTARSRIRCRSSAVETPSLASWRSASAAATRVAAWASNMPKKSPFRGSSRWNQPNI